MFRLYVRHDVADFDHWFSGYSENADIIKELGVVGEGVYTGVGNSQDVTVWHDFETREAAEAFKSHPKLAEAFKALRVTGTPQLWVTEAVS